MKQPRRPPVPHWIEKGESHDERLSSERAKKYPLLIVSNHGRWRVHANHDDITWTREIPTCKVNGPDGLDWSREEEIEGWALMVSAFPGFEWSTDALVAEGDRVVNISTIKGTHKGTFMGIPATGKQILVKWVTLYKIGGGKILEGWEFPDMLGMMTQLGVVPSTVLKT